MAHAKGRGTASPRVSREYPQRRKVIICSSSSTKLTTGVSNIEYGVVIISVCTNLVGLIKRICRFSMLNAHLPTEAKWALPTHWTCAYKVRGTLRCVGR